MTIGEILKAVDEEIARLREARDLLSSAELQARRTSLVGTGAVRALMSQVQPLPKKRGMSAEGRARIAAAQKMRWAKRTASPKPRRKVAGADGTGGAKRGRKKV